MVARRIAGCVVAIVVAVVGCGDGSDDETEPIAPEDSDVADVTTSLSDAVDTADAGEGAADTGPAWDEVVSGPAIGADGRVYVAGTTGVAALSPDGEWATFHVDQLPAGSGAPFPRDWPPELPGRMVDHVAVGPDGEVWLAGVSFSRVDDEQFGGAVNPFFDARFLQWIATGDCDSGSCAWEVFTSDAYPALDAAIGDLVVGPDGTVFAAAGERTLLVHDDSGWQSHVVPCAHVIDPWSESLAVGPDGTLWAGSYSGLGLIAFDGVDFTRHSTDEIFPGAEELQVSASPDGAIWVAEGTSQAEATSAAPDAAPGIASFDGTAWTAYTTDDGLLSDYGVVAAGPDSIVWVVHHDLPQYGYSRFDGTTWSTYPVEQPLVGSAHVGPDGTLWSVTLDAHFTEAVVEEMGLFAFDGTAETIHPWPFASPAERPDAPLPVLVEVDVPYASDFALDVYHPDAAGPWPVAVVFHGGEMAKSSVRSYATAVAEQGVVVFVPEYSSTPAQLRDDLHLGAEDAVCAMRFARDHASDFGGRSDRIVTAGASYGANVAALMVLGSGEFEGDCLVSSDVSTAADGLVGLDGMYDFATLPAVLGFQEDYTVEQLQRASAITYIRPADPTSDTAFHLFTGRNPAGQDQAGWFIDALTAAGYEVTLIEQPEVPHNAYGGVVPGTVEALTDMAFG